MHARFIAPLMLFVAACASVEPVTVSPAPKALAGAKVKLPAEVLLTGERLDAALDVDPELALTLRNKLAQALAAAGYQPVGEADQPFDLQLEASVAVTRVSRALSTGTYANLSGRLRVFTPDRALDTLRATSHPDDARFYPSLDEAADRVVGQLVNALSLSPRVKGNVNGGEPRSQTQGEGNADAPQRESQGSADSTNEPQRESEGHADSADESGEAVPPPPTPGQEG